MLSVVTADELAWPRASQLFVATTQLIPILCTEKISPYLKMPSYAA